MSVSSRYERGQLVFYEGHRHRIVGGVGSDFQTVYESDFHDSEFQVAGGTGTDPTGWTTTVVEGGATPPTSEVTKLDDGDGVISFITANADNDGIQIQRADETVLLTANKDVYFGVRIDALNDATQTDYLLGLAVTDTTLLGGVADGVYFEKLDGGTDVNFVTEVGSAETTTAAVATQGTGGSILEFYCEGTSTVYAYVDGVRVATHTAGITAEEMAVSLAFLTGEAVSNNLNLDWLRCYQIGRG